MDRKTDRKGNRKTPPGWVLLYHAIILLCYASPGFPARPFTTDDADPVDVKVLEFESGTDIISDKPGEYSTYFSLKHGITGRVDIGFDFSYEYPSISALGIGAKIRLLEAKLEKTKTNQKVTLTIGYATGNSTFDLNLISATEFESAPVSVFLNVGSVSSLEKAFIGVSPQVLVWRLNVGMELFGEYSLDKKKFSPEGFFGIAFTAFESDKFSSSLDAGLGYIMDEKKPRITFGVTCDF